MCSWWLLKKLQRSSRKPWYQVNFSVAIDWMGYLGHKIQLIVSDRQKQTDHSVWDYSRRIWKTNHERVTYLQRVYNSCCPVFFKLLFGHPEELANPVVKFKGEASSLVVAKYDQNKAEIIFQIIMIHWLIYFDWFYVPSAETAYTYRLFAQRLPVSIAWMCSCRLISSDPHYLPLLQSTQWWVHSTQSCSRSLPPRF